MRLQSETDLGLPRNQSVPGATIHRSTENGHDVAATRHDARVQAADDHVAVDYLIVRRLEVCVNPHSKPEIF